MIGMGRGQDEDDVAGQRSFAGAEDLEELQRPDSGRGCSTVEVGSGHCRDL